MIKQLAAIAVVSTLIAAPGYAIEEGDTAPAWTAIGFDGNEVSFPEVLDGKPAVVVFWATWCAYCKAFMPLLEGIQAEYGADRVQIVLINTMEDGTGDPRGYIDDLSFQMVAVTDGNDAIATGYGVAYTPWLMVVDADSEVVYRRAPTQMAAGAAVSSLWLSQIRNALGSLLEQ